MIEISQKQFLMALFVLFLFTGSLLAQIVKCNQEVFIRNHKQDIPKEVCIPAGYIIYYIYNKEAPIDFNQDGLNDFIFRMNKKSISIGDTSFLVFYKMNPDSSFTFVKKYDNVLPVYFNPSDESPKIEDVKLEELFNCYPIPNPLNHIEIKNDEIEMIVNLDGHFFEGYNYKYKFDKKANDWKLIKKTFYQAEIGKDIKIDKELYLSEFSYCEF